MVMIGRRVLAIAPMISAPREVTCDTRDIRYWELCGKDAVLHPYESESWYLRQIRSSRSDMGERHR